ncbi:hypothetical protein [Bacillus pseudomycoides]|uniref:hypothetical protein n=1 Tax=Bacillus pseudomycoides TaxID=64104 RepID=UPI002FFDFD89
MALKELGIFEIKSNKIVVSDPCYPIEFAVTEDEYVEGLSLMLTPANFRIVCYKIGSLLIN